jgi:hypothetical protein
VDIGYKCFKQLSFKIFFKSFLSQIEKILSYSSKFKYLNQKGLLSHIEKHNFFSCKHRVLYNILKELSAPVTVYLDTKHYGLE